MVVGRALRQTGCVSCRLNILKSLAAISGPIPRTKNVNTRLRPPNLAHQARLSSTTINSGISNHVPDVRLSEGVYNATIEEEHEEAREQELGGGETNNELPEEIPGDEQLPEELSEQEDADRAVYRPPSTIPWYLEVNAPQRELQPLSERQRIPDLPESPPPILEPLLQQVSIDLGLDSLAILDLRKLDPPPALGANLLMLIGTARSEKHLHVSADRLCRWLRSTYKLRPDADGLLGRNELKLKLKRKAKRNKLLGKSTADNDDDGVRTGWVCVDVGVVDGGKESTVSIAKPQDFIGFGRRTDGVRLVVQMLTEGKREEMDLERLWKGILKRGVPAEIEALEEDQSSELSTATTKHALTDGSIRRPAYGTPELKPSRGFHTSARQYRGMKEPGGLVRHLSPNISFSGRESVTLSEVQQYVAVTVGAGRFKEAKQYILQQQDKVPELRYDRWRRLLLEQLRFYLESSSSERAFSDLGKGASGRHSTPFSKCFHETISPHLSEFDGEILIWLHTYAAEIEHPGYGFHDLMALFRELQLSGLRLFLETYLRLIRAVFRRSTNHNGKYDGPPRYVVEGAMEILQAMYDQGHNILTEDILVALQESTTSEKPISKPLSVYVSAKDTFELPSASMNAIQRRIHVLMKSIDLPTFRAESRLKLLAIYAANNHWVEFWEVWSLALRQGRPQTALLYAFMFSKVAETQHQKACIAVLRTWLPDLQREVPSVPLEGEAAQAVEACLLVADPFVKQESEDPKAKGEWVSMWRRCQSLKDK